METRTGQIHVQTENIFPIIKKFLYSDHEIFLRELVSNAVDACQKIKVLSSTGEFKGQMGELAVRVRLDKEARTLTISDSGIGMTAEEIDKYINQIAFSGAEEFVQKYKGKKALKISLVILVLVFIRPLWWQSVFKYKLCRIKKVPKLCNGKVMEIQNSPLNRFKRKHAAPTSFFILQKIPWSF
jgi:hypothetical protein